MGMWPGPSTMTCVPFSCPRRVSSPSTAQFGELGLVAGVGDRAGTQTVAEAPGHVVLPHDVAQIVEARVQRVGFAVGHHPLGDERPAAADDARHAVHRQVQVLQHHAAVDGHVVHALLGLVLDHVQKMLRTHVLDLAPQLLEHLVNGDRSDGHGRGVDDRLPDGVDVLAGREVHDRVGAEVDRHVQLVQLFAGVAGDGRVADVGVDLALDRRADRHRLEPLGQVDLVGGNDHAARGHFVAYGFSRNVLALGDEFHFGRDGARASLENLCHGASGCLRGHGDWGGQSPLRRSIVPLCGELSIKPRVERRVNRPSKSTLSERGRAPSPNGAKLDSPGQSEAASAAQAPPWVRGRKKDRSPNGA